MTKFINTVKSFAKDEEGAFASEYAVFLVLIAATLVAAVMWLGAVIEGAVDQVRTVINDGIVASGGTAIADPSATP